MEPWQVLPQNATLRDRLITNEVSLRVLYSIGTLVDELDYPMAEFRWDQQRNRFSFTRPPIPPTFEQRAEFWESVRPYSGPPLPTLRQRIERFQRRKRDGQIHFNPIQDLDQPISEAGWFVFRTRA